MGGVFSQMHNSDNKIPESFLAEIRPHYETILNRLLQKAKTGWVCPSCGNGSKGKGNDGIIPDPTHENCIKCFGCPEYGDVFHWVMLAERCGFREAVKICADIVGIPFNDEVITIHRRKPQPPPPAFAELQEEPEVDLSDYIAEAEKHLEETDYWQQRGLSINTCRHFKLGFIAQWLHPKVLKRKEIDPDFKAPPPSPRLIIPTSLYSLLARLARPANKYEKNFTKMKIGKVHVFNTTALEQEVCFLTEGEIDAMSVYEVCHDDGIDCAALGSKSYDRIFVNYVAGMTKRPKIIIICPDNDKDAATIKEVERCTKYISEELNKLGVFTHVAKISGEYKDANDALVNDRENFAKAIKQAKEDAVAKFEQLQNTNKSNSVIDAEVINHGCEFIKIILNKKTIQDEKIVDACFTCVLKASNGQDIVKETLQKWLKDDYTEEKAQEYIDRCKDKECSCNYIRNELGFA